MNQTVSSIENDGRLLANKIREFCKSQKDLWKQIPALALNADGRTGWSDDLPMAYHHRFWPIMRLSEYITLTIDLNKGELGLNGYIDRPAADKDIIGLGLMIEKIDASKIIEDLKNQALHRPDHSIVYNKKDPNWRKDLAETLGLSI